MENGATRDNLKVFSEPITLRWDGWETNTHHLQRSGWQLSADQNVRNQTMQIAARHPNGLSLLTEMTQWQYARWPDNYFFRHYAYPPMRVKALGKVEMVFYGVGRFGFEGFNAIDTEPQVAEITRGRLEDFYHFAPVTSPHDLIVPQDSVPELLERILKLQQPASEQRAKARVAARLLTL